MLGLLAAVLGGWVDQMLGRAVDVLMAIPQLIFALVLLSIFGTSTRQPDPHHRRPRFDARLPPDAARSP